MIGQLIGYLNKNKKHPPITPERRTQIENETKEWHRKREEERQKKYKEDEKLRRRMTGDDLPF